MSLSVAAKRDLLSHLAALSDLEITAEQFDGLRALVKSDAEAAQLYVEHQFLEALLHWSIDRETGSGAPGADVPPQQRHAAAAAHPTVTFPAKTDGGLLHQILHFQLSGKIIGVAASVLLVGYFASVASLLLWDYLRQSNRAQVDATSPALPLATLKRAKDCRWGTARPPQPGAPLHDGLLKLDAGMAELELAKGVSVLVQGPAEVRVETPGSCFLQHGRLVARVPREAIGFTVETPQAKIVDLGTEFGVETKPAGGLNVYVFRGEVEVEEKTSDTPRRAAAKRVRLRMGQSARVEAGVATAVATERSVPEPFVPLRAAQQPLAAAVITPYGDDPHTLHLWHFDDESGADSAGLNPHTKPLPLVLAGEGVAILPSTTLGLSGFGRGLHLPGPRNGIRGAYNESPQFNGPDSAKDNISTATFWNQWAKDDSLGAFTYEALIEIGFDPRQETGAYDLCTLESDADDGGKAAFQLYVISGAGNGLGVLHFINVAINQVVVMPLPGKLDPDAPTAGGWYHVAIVYTGEEFMATNVNFYWTRMNPPDGVLPRTARLLGKSFMHGDLASPMADFCIGNLARSHPVPEQWIGTIDEVRISDVARRPEEFLFHRRANVRP